MMSNGISRDMAFVASNKVLIGLCKPIHLAVTLPHNIKHVTLVFPFRLYARVVQHSRLGLPSAQTQSKNHSMRDCKGMNTPCVPFCGWELDFWEIKPRTVLVECPISPTFLKLVIDSWCLAYRLWQPLK